MNAKTLLLSLVLVVFSAFSIELVVTQGYFGFLTVAMREGWALQMLVDVVILVGLAVAFMIPDARSRGISAWPYVVASVALGSIGVLAYVIRREWAPAPSTARVTA